MIRILRGKGTGRALDVDPTVGNFKDLSIFYPDQPLVDWKEVSLGKMVSATDLSGEINVCVVGRGAGALAAMTELNEIAKKNPNLKINVTNLYYDTEVESARDPAVSYENKWGRIFSVKPGSNYQEIGCMRFPSIAQLTWNYIAKAYPGQEDEPLQRFPNPGRVPTQFIYRDMSVTFEIDSSGNSVAIPGMNNSKQIEDLSTMEAVKNGVINYMLNDVTASNGKSVAYFADLLIGAPGQDPEIIGMTEGNKKAVWREWNTFIEEWDVPLIDIVQKAIDELISGGDIQETETRDRSYYVELFGRYGLGTGGFRPLNNVSFNEIARLLIWNYSDEYLFPGNSGDSSSANFDFAQRLFDEINSNSSLENFSSESRKVLFIGKHLDDSPSLGKLAVVCYDASNDRIESFDFDYVVLATTHHAAQRILEPFAGVGRLNSISPGTKLYFDIEGESRFYTTTNRLEHPFDRSKGAEGSLYAALKNLHMMRTTKYFTDVSTDQFEEHSPVNFQGDKRVKMVISDTDLAATYCLDGQDGTTNILVSYSWGDEASNEATSLRGLTEYAGSNDDPALRSRHAQSANRFTATPNSSELRQFWIADMLNAAGSQSGYMYDWSADQDSRGGFKLDGVSETAFSTALFDHYRTSQGGFAKQRLFVAGDSFSHYGGWLEGAFMTAITSIAGVMYSEFGGDVFSSEGIQLFNTPE